MFTYGVLRLVEQGKLELRRSANNVFCRSPLSRVTSALQKLRRRIVLEPSEPDSRTGQQMTVQSQFISRRESGLATRAKAISICNASSRRLLANRSTNI